jgi:hypothetical protein
MKANETKIKMIPAEKLDAMFDNGEDISAYVDHASTTFPNQKTKPFRNTKKVNLDLPVDLLGKIDEEAHRIGITRQALLKVWLAERIDKLSAHLEP